MKMRDAILLGSRGGAVKRYHAVDTLKTQTVAEHSFGVAWFVFVMYGGAPPVSVMCAALMHDLAEHVTGDIPAPAKRALGIGEQFTAYEDDVLADYGVVYPTLTPEEQRVLKAADTLELLQFCAREIRLGNTNMIPVFNRGENYIAELGGAIGWPNDDVYTRFSTCCAVVGSLMKGERRNGER